MRPTKTNTSQELLFQSRLSTQLNPKHPLYVLGQALPWQLVEEHFAPLFNDIPGCPPKPVRLMVGLFMLAHIEGISDESVVSHWVENPYWQYFCGFDHLQWEMPIDPSSMTRWRKRLGVEGMEWILSLTVHLAVAAEVVQPKSLEKVMVDTTVMEKNVTFPTDSKLLHKARERLVVEAKRLGVNLRQSYTHVSSRAALQAARYAHAKQMKRMARETKRLKTYLGRVVRDLERKLPESSHNQALTELLTTAKRLLVQEKKSKNKVYSVHEPEAVSCIAKGKARHPYEFGCKVSLGVTHKEGLVVAALALAGNPHDGKTLQATLKQAKYLSGTAAKDCFVDRGYKGHGVTDVNVYISGQKRGMTPSLKRQLKRRSMIEPMIGHRKNEGRLRRNYLKGGAGDQLNALLCGIGPNLRMLLSFLMPFLHPLMENLAPTNQTTPQQTWA
jgi:IS5 family transposase